ncbi:hypothetical protein [Aeromonas sp. QDB56]|uniref:hypothetical protein n=1 Tax=Aeromonas sp. QDB56 TaxID=2990495 RepID=UPI0022E7D534|nr:hypothetical protein [Aeromonas sp. QDB56]
MCITNLSQLNAAYLLNAGGCTSITAQLADLLKRQQRRCTLDTGLVAQIGELSSQVVI